MKIYTDNKWKDFKYGNKIPKEVLKRQFDYMEEDEIFDGFILYRKSWYHLSEFMRIDVNAPSEFKNYDGYISDTFFSGVLIKISYDGEQYKIATYIS